MSPHAIDLEDAPTEDESENEQDHDDDENRVQHVALLLEGLQCKGRATNVLVVPAHSFHSEVGHVREDLEVAWVFERTVHLRTRARWIVSVTSGPWDGPLSIRVEPDIRFSALVEPGQVCRWRDGWLEMGAICIDAREAVDWDPPARTAGWDVSAVLNDLDVVIERSRCADSGGIPTHILADEQAHRPLDAMSTRAYVAVRAVRRAVDDRDSSGLASAMLSLVGLGPGLTPSGDDLLCGFTAGLAVFLARRDRCPVLVPEIMRAALFGAIDATTSLSRTLLACASGCLPLSGRIGGPVVTEPLLGVLWSLGTPGGMRDLDALLRIGHSSGSDMLAGIWMAARVVLEGRDVDGLTVVGSA